jgi:DNA-binding transcriptional LysR family regulator
MDRLGNIEAFVAVVQCGSFTLAARRLGISPSALSRRVSQLEEQVGIRLLNRTTRAVRLAEDGRGFYERAQAALHELREAQEATSQLRARPAGSLRVEAPTIVGLHVIVPALPLFLKRFPDIEVDLSLRDHAADMVSSRIDVSIRLGALDDSGLIARKLGRTRMRVCGAPAYLRRRGRPTSVAALERHDRLGFSMHGRPISWRLRDGSKERELPPSRHIAVDNAEALLELARAGVGLAWVCDFMMARAERASALTELVADASCVTSPIQAVSLPSRIVLPKVRAFVDFVAAELAKCGVAR